MIAHVLLFRLKSGVTETSRLALTAALHTVLERIPSLERFRIGRRVKHGRPYEALMRTDYPLGAILEFRDTAAARAYFEHPAHDELAARFFDVIEEAMIYDYELREGVDGIAALR